MTKKISILIVDDEESVRDSLLSWFKEDGYHVECAENAKKALLILESHSFDIILFVVCDVIITGTNSYF